MSQLFAVGLEITLIGMAVVFALLTALVFIVQGMSRLAHAIGGAPSLPKPAGADDEARVAAAVAAVHAYRARHRR